MRATDIAAGAPVWVYALLAVLVVLGARRLRTREMPVPVALMPTAAFLLWSLVGATAFAGRAGAGIAAGAWLAGAMVGGASGFALPDTRGLRLLGGRVRLPGSPLPLFLYLGVFVVRFGCGAWAAIAPAQAIPASAIGVAVGAAVTARLLVGVTRWQKA